MLNNRIVMCLAAAVAVLVGGAAQADVFNMGPGLTSLQFVTVGNPGNPGEQSRLAAYGDTTYYGSVADPYLIGKYEVTNAQWREFLTHKASASDPYGLYDVYWMALSLGGIDRTWSGDHFVYTPKGGDTAWDNRPVNYVTFWDAARFSNWLHNGQGDGDTESGAYVNIGNQDTFARQSGAKYFIPTENEWYKAAFHKNDGVTGNYFDWPTGSDSVPSNDLIDPDPGNNANFCIRYDGDYDYSMGGPYWTTVVGDFENSESPYNTFDQGGNVWEWNETAIAGSSRGRRAGDWISSISYLASSWRVSNDPEYVSGSVGFRVASVPEPGSITLVVCGAIAGLIWWRRRR